MAEMTKKSAKVARQSGTGKFTKIPLKDGRTIYGPPSGGKLSKTQIRRAVREVSAERRKVAQAS